MAGGQASNGNKSGSYGNGSKSGAGSRGTSYSGGTGGGGCYVYVKSGSEANRDGSLNGGTGGKYFMKSSSGSYNRPAGGGAGNPGGLGYDPSGGNNNGENGTGGLLILYANILDNYGKISADGSKGGKIGTIGRGGCSGGGSINIYYKTTCNLHTDSSGEISVKGETIAITGKPDWQSGGNGTCYEPTQIE